MVELDALERLVATRYTLRDATIPDAACPVFCGIEVRRPPAGKIVFAVNTGIFHVELPAASHARNVIAVLDAFSIGPGRNAPYASNEASVRRES